jgi:Glucose-6-phosphate dehydrogenase, C-terminal domain
LSKSQNSRLRSTQHSEENAHGYHHASRHCTSHPAAWWRRLVRPWTLVLKGELSWRIMQPVLDAWAAEKADFPNYDSGSDGPKPTDELLTDDGGRAWRPVSLSSEQKP